MGIYEVSMLMFNGAILCLVYFIASTAEKILNQLLKKSNFQIINTAKERKSK